MRGGFVLSFLNLTSVVKAGALTGVILFMSLSATEAGGRREQSLPASMFGRWGWAVESCNNIGDDGRMKVKARSVEFFASSYKLKTITAENDGWFQASALIHEEGEPGTLQGVISLKLLAPGILSVRTEPNDTQSYIRCRK
jgi:hypothetical protein